ncbi:MAG TPA: hypothetical protein VMK12_07550 [Anaeromyxobacteraceae bacterium]|nr:hypothetical protein [Anaeromyxobacteraceae bacterium]
MSNVRLHVVPIVVLLGVCAAEAMVGGTPAPHTLLNVATQVVKIGGEWTFYGCSGTMISPRVYVTVAHCAILIDVPTDPDYLVPFGYPPHAPIDHWELGITFSSDLQVTNYFDPLPAGTKVYPARVVLYPGWTWDNDLGPLFEGNPPAFTDTSEEVDLAVYLLDEPVSGIRPAKVVEEGFFDRDPQQLEELTFGFAGYGMGTSEACDFSATPDFGVRRYAAMKYEGTYAAKVDLRGDRACAEDSGGPVFVVDNAHHVPRYVDTVSGTLQGDPSSSQSGKADVFTRLDTPKAQRFLRRFLGGDHGDR